jgi:hypothetical protein
MFRPIDWPLQGWYKKRCRIAIVAVKMSSESHILVRYTASALLKERFYAFNFNTYTSDFSEHVAKRDILYEKWMILSVK